MSFLHVSSSGEIQLTRWQGDEAGLARLTGVPCPQINLV